MEVKNAGLIPLRTGDPAVEPASFTRFALPFVWKLEAGAVATSPPSLFYDEIQPAGIVARARYFTPETADVLFKRARWFALRREPDVIAEPKTANPDGPDRSRGSEEFRRFRLRIGDADEIEIALAMPQLVLFEAKGDRRVDLASTGFLLVDIYFPKDFKIDSAVAPSPPTLDDLLLLNELFRYWRQPFDSHPRKEHRSARGTTRFQTMMSKVAKVVHEAGGPAMDPYLDRWDWLLSLPIKCDGRFRALTLETCKAARSWAGAKDAPRVPKAKMTPTEAVDLKALIDRTGWVAYTDERAFVWTCAITAHGAKDLTSFWKTDPSLTGMWVRLLNVDAPSTSPATAFEKEWVRGRTYERWKHFGTLYGFNTHSAAMLASPCSEPPICRHFSELYFDQILLLLYLRVSIFRFEVQLARISENLVGDLWGQTSNEFRKLRAAFSFLTNLYRFPLVSSQQQGIEMYVHMRDALDINELFTEVQEEIKTTHEMFEFTTTSKMGEATAFLAIGALLIGVLTTVVALLGVHDIKHSPGEAVLRVFDRLPWLLPSVWLIGLSFIGSLAGAAVLSHKWFGRWWFGRWKGWFGK
jgi:hypothetical protein